MEITYLLKKKNQKTKEGKIYIDFFVYYKNFKISHFRLVRDDEHEESDEERIDMDLNPALRDQERRREQFMAAQESDHEVDDWEAQQIRKGVTGAAMEAAREMLYPLECPSPPQISAPTIDPGIHRTPEMIVHKLREHYESIQQSREKHEKQLEKTQEDIKHIKREIEDLKIKAPEAANKFRFYQELRGYITDLVECLDEKVGIIEALEQRDMDLMAKKSYWLIERRRQDVRDQAEEATNKGAVLRKDPEIEEKQRRAAEREGRRTRRRRAREQPGQPKHIEGKIVIKRESMSNSDYF